MAIGGNNTTATVTLNANMDPSGVLSAVKAMQGAFNNLKLPNNIGENLDKSLSKATDLLKKYQSQLQKGINTKTDAKNISKTGTQINEVLDEITHYINELNGQQIFLKADVSGLNKLKTDIDNARTAWKNAIQEFRKGSDINKVLNQIGEKTTRSNLTQGSINKAKTLFDKGDLEGYKNALDDIYNRLRSLKDTTIKNVTENLGLADAGSKAANLEQIRKKLEEISKIDFSSDANVKAQFDEITSSVGKYEEELTRAGSAGQEAFNSINASSAVNNTRALVDATDQYTNSVMSAKDQVQDLQRSTQYFFSLRNMINLFKRGIDDAIQSVKDLDKAMTDTAVVTDYKVSDMWNMLPEYTKLANELGATTQGAYETMTLYFQQGLDQQAAFEIGAETMKMARIAGLDYAETTDMMTAALRGFNMELNETSAKRINDVYSKLAAITASDTEELGTAMQRTASIAHSAGMSFEGTTAFLAQAIETTREPAENIGTAMKTIIARFQEMKKNPLEITEVEGEEVDFNKVDAALKTIGVDLKDTNGQFRELDKVFLDISQRWDSLTQTQQRYIATTAAGSRQQSRFIAMMDNYDRTMELVSAANNSAGASEEQFAKTADSLEFKLNQLHNAWQAFTMGIANNGMIKTAVDGITTLLTNVNKLIDTFSFGIGPLKSFLSIFTAFTGLKAAGKVANAAIGGLGSLVDPQTSFRQGLFGGGTGLRQAASASQAAMIYSPIVNELRGIRAQMPNKGDINQATKQNNPYKQYEQFKQARQDILKGTKAGNTFLPGDYTRKFKGLTAQQQQILRDSSPVSAYKVDDALLKGYGASGDILKDLRKGQQRYRNDAKVGTLAWEQYFNKVSDPVAMKTALESSPNVSKATMDWVDGMVDKTTAQAKMNIQEAMFEGGKLNDITTPQQMQQRVEEMWNSMTEEQRSAARSKAFKDEADKETPLKNTKGGKLLDAAAKVGSGISSAGMGLQTFGSLLTSSANPALQVFGTALVSAGSLLSGLGGLVSGLSTGFTAVAESSFMTSVATDILGASEEAAAATALSATAVVGGVIAALGLLAFAIKKHNDNIRKAAEEVTTTYKDKSEKAQTNISNLQSWKEDFARLSSGVDSNGYNINLSNEDYDRYLEIVRGIAEINPTIVEGYNAQGQAIISNNKALEETLALEKEKQQEAFADYTDPKSLETLKQARDLSRQRKRTDANPFAEKGESHGGNLLEGYEFKPQASMRKSAERIGSMLQAGVKSGWASEDLLADFNIDINKLAEGDADTLKAFDQLGPKIQQRISNAMDAAGDEVADSTKESMLKAFTSYSDAADEFDELIGPMHEQLMATMSPYASSIPEEFKKYFNQGLKDIVSDAEIDDVGAAAQEFANKFSALTEEGGDYYKILEDVEDAQNQYAQTLDKDAYEEFISGTDGAIDRINDLKQSLIDDGMDMTQGYGKAISDFLDNEIRKIEDFTSTGAANLQHALNTMTDQIAAAEGTLESFNSIAEGSTYGKAASNMSQIFETATADEHILGQGDQAFWAGAEALVGRKNLLEGGDLTKDKALAQMKEVQEMLKGGQEGWDNFKTKWFENADANFKVLEDGSRRLLDKNGEIIEGLTLDDNNWFSEINEDLNPEVYEQIADALDMSKDSLVAMLNLGRQFGEVNFTNVGEVRKALATSDTTIKNADNGKVFVRRESLESEMTSAGIDLNKQQEIEKDLQDNYNTELIKEVGDITKDNQQFSAMGIDNMESLVKTFEATGQFTKDEIQAYGEKWAEINDQQFNPEEFNRLWNENQTDQEFGGIPSSLTSIESILSSIEGILASQRLSEGYLDNSTAKDAQKWLFGGEGEDTNAQQFWKGHGSGKNGEITTSEFNKTSKDLTDFIATSKDYVDQLKSAEKNAANETEKQEIEAERKAYENMVERAETYLKEGTEAYNNQIQSKIEGLQKDKDLVDQGFADLFSGITPESINTDQAQSTLNQLYEAAINNTPAVLTDGLMTQMQTLGIDIQRAIDAGLVVDSNKVWESAQNKGKEAADGVTEGATSGANSADTSGSKTAGENKGKEVVDKTVEGAKTGASNADTSGAQQAGQEAAEKTNEAYTAGTHQAAPGMPSNVPPNMTPATSTPTPTETKVTVDDSELVAANQTAQDLSSTLSQGGQYNIQVTGADALKQAASDARSITKNSGNKSVAVSASFDSGAVTKGLSAIKGMKAKMQVGATVDPAIAAARRAQRTIDSMKATIDVSTSVTGQNVHIYVTKHEKTVKSHTGGLIVPGGPIYRARGGLASDPRFKKEGTDTIPAMLTPGEYVQNRDAVQYFGVDFMRKINHKDLKGALQSFGSAAKGRRGRLGPDGNGGLTLTGEKGYEIAWIPSESRSMILGANGPQMAELPSDAIIWDHKQSKKIMSQNAIPAGSHYVTSTGATRPGTTTIARNTSTGTDKSIQDTSNKVKKAAEESKEKIARVSVWWENIARRTEVTQRKMDDNAKAFEKYIKKMDVTLKTTGTKGGGNDYIQNIKDYSALNAEQVGRANKELKQLEDGAGKNSEKKKAQGKLKKQYKSGDVNISEVSYDKKGKSKKVFVNLASYITKDKKTGALQVDEAALKKIKNSNKRKAVADAANKEIDDRTSKKTKAEDAIKKAEEALEKMGQDLYETFFAWETELTKIWNLTQKIEAAEGKVARTKEYSSLLDAELASGYKTAEQLSEKRKAAYQKEVTQETQILKERAASIADKQAEIKKAYSLADEVTTLNSITAKLNSSQASQDKINAAKAAVDKKQSAADKAKKELEQNKNTPIFMTKKDKKGNRYRVLDRGAMERRNKALQAQLNKANEELAAAKTNYTNVQNANKGNVLNATEKLGYETYAKQLSEDVKAQQLASKYTTITENKDGTVDINFDTSALETDKLGGKITADEAKKIEEYVKNIKDKNEDLSNTYKDITSGLSEMHERLSGLKEAWANYANQLWDISEKEQTERVNQLKNLSSNITDALKKLLDQVKKKLDERRKQEDNAKTEKDISQKQQRLAALQADTSGGHQVEIAQLQQEIADAQQNYQRSLEDQLLERLQEQADVAAEQRERLIELTQNTVDAVNNAALVNQWMDNPEEYKQQIYEAFMTANEADQKPEALRQQLELEFEQLYNGLLTNQQEQEMVSTAIKELSEGDNAPLTLIEKSLAEMAEALKTFKPNQDIKQEADTAVSNAAKATTTTTTAAAAPKKTAKDEYKDKLAAAQKKKKIGGKEFAEVQKKANAAGLHARTYMMDLAKTAGLTWDQVIKAAEAAPNKFSKYRIALSFNTDNFIKGYEKVHGKGSYKKDVATAKKKKLKPYEYATGGLADYTGPAWLDGTPSKPELVLNAKDTQNFIALKDVLSKAMKSTDVVESRGDATFEININVDHLNNDYDVDKVVERVKKKIVQDSSYRNVTQVRKFR